MIRYLFMAALAVAAGGCQTHDNLLTGPELSPVGEGLAVRRDALPVSFAAPRRTSFQSLWTPADNDMFKDIKARSVGDVVTVNISIDDKAQFDNTSDRSRKSDVSLGFGALLDWTNFSGLGKTGNASGNLGVQSGSTSSGSGSIDRSEKLKLSIAAVVTEELPNGNLLLSGSQEVMVNNEVRVLNIAGIVRPSDISTDNAVSYDKIAEARISYGGRGRISDVQKPAWGHRVYDAVVPF